MGAEPLEARDIVLVADADHVLLDDQALVQVLGDVVRGRPDQLHAAFACALVGPGAGEHGQEGMVDVDDRHREALEQLTGEHVHVARENDEVAVTVEQREQHRLGGRLVLLGDRDVVIWQPGRLDLGPQVGVIGSDEHEIAVRLVVLPTPQRLRQAVVLTRDKTAIRLRSRTSSTDQRVPNASATSGPKRSARPCCAADKTTNCTRRKNVAVARIGGVLV